MLRGHRSSSHVTTGSNHVSVSRVSSRRPRQGLRRRGGSPPASGRHPSARPRQGLLRRGGSPLVPLCYHDSTYGVTAFRAGPGPVTGEPGREERQLLPCRIRARQLPRQIMTTIMMRILNCNTSLSSSEAQATESRRRPGLPAPAARPGRPPVTNGHRSMSSLRLRSPMPTFATKKLSDWPRRKWTKGGCSFPFQVCP